jgi:hypothetical protein
VAPHLSTELLFIRFIRCIYAAKIRKESFRPAFISRDEYAEGEVKNKTDEEFYLLGYNTIWSGENKS